MSEQSGFQLSGSAPEMYERYIAATICTALTEDLVTSAALQSGSRVLDVACGTGVVTRRAAQAVGSSGEVTGLDVNAGMLAMARSLASPDDASTTYQEGSATDIPFSDATFDVVFCQHGLEFFPDRGQSLREMHRVLKPGGQLGLRVWRPLEHQPFHVAVLAGLDRYLWRGERVPSRAGFAQPFSFGDADALRTVVAEAGFRDIELRTSTIPWRFGSSAMEILGYLSALPLSGEVIDMEETTRSAMLNDTLAALAPFVDGEALVVPAESHVVMARS